MSKDSLYHTKSYEWFGTFWFLDDPGKEFSGRLKYTPEQGIVLELLELFETPGLKKMFDDSDELARRIMHGIIVDNNETRHVTLINILFYRRQISTGWRATTGSAAAIVFDLFLEKMNVNSLVIEYDEIFQSAFVSPMHKESLIMKLSQGDPIKINQDLEISWSEYPLGNIYSFYGVDDLETIFLSREDKGLKKLKKIFSSQDISSFRYNLLDRKNIRPRIWFGKNSKSLEDLSDLEKKWRLFWELVIDCPISIDRAWVHQEEKNEQGGVYPMLCDQYKQKNFRKKKPPLMQSLPISFYTLSKNKLDLGSISEIINKWIQINKNPDWKLVIEGVRQILSIEKSLADKTQYVSLYWEIETLMDLLGHGDGHHTQNFIEKYASDKWRQDISKIFNCLSSPEAIAKYISKIRASIVHPRGTKNEVEYQSFISSEPNIHETHAHIAGLFIKAVLKHITNLEEEILNNFMHKFIEKRAFLEKIVYK